MQIYLICLVKVLDKQQILVPYDSNYYAFESDVLEVVEILRGNHPGKAFTYKTLNPAFKSDATVLTATNSFERQAYSRLDRSKCQVINVNNLSLGEK